MCYCSSGDPEGGAWARQEWRDGCGWHHFEERLLHWGAQSEETLTDRTWERQRENKRENHLNDNWLCCDTPSLCLSAHWSLPLTPPAASHPVNNICLRSAAGLSQLSMNKRTESNLMGGSWQHTTVFSASLGHLVTLKPACTHLPWKCPSPNAALAGFQSHRCEGDSFT